MFDVGLAYAAESREENPSSGTLSPGRDRRRRVQTDGWGSGYYKRGENGGNHDNEGRELMHRDPCLQSYDWVLDEENALPILKASWDKGTNTVDMANDYRTQNENESLLYSWKRIAEPFYPSSLTDKRWVERYLVTREKIIIASKISTGLRWDW
ncbi:hypothetical protein EDD18DRAFT_1110992 [Armillaria luteobubalina]|uniref:Uncharacterized protein n=1 Tax=Armillaria luteobubalina TaxID=153913 RepID=A0AA39UP37_9AGAR|nr:hypothetical protein EDD18DRAFT_1110992 [Armillaria luteobubalina]